MKHDFAPQIFNLKKGSHRDEFDALRNASSLLRINDEIEPQLKELFAINNPQLSASSSFDREFNHYKDKIIKELGSLDLLGKWIYYPWRATFVHILDEPDFYKVKTARNKHLITEKEQQCFYNTTVGIAGLSVGNSIAMSILLEGGAKKLKLVDLDTLELSNLNRIRSSITELGLNKARVTARQIYELNPYTEIQLYEDGLTETNIEDFFSGSMPLDIVIDEIDTLAMKFRIREYAQKHKIPVLMAADNGDGGVVDIERYDSSPSPSFFHGRFGETSFEELNGLNKFQTGRKIGEYVGFENIPIRMYESLAELGNSLVSWPQLGGAAVLNGVLLSYCVKQIANAAPLHSGRVTVSMDELFIPDYNSPEYVEQRQQKRTQFTHLFAYD